MSNRARVCTTLVSVARRDTRGTTRERRRSVTDTPARRSVGRRLPLGDLRGRVAGRRALVGSLVSVAGLRGRPVVSPDGARVGRLEDVVVRWDRGVYPEVSGLIVRVGLRRAFVHAAEVASLAVECVTMASTRFDLRDFERRPGEWLVLGDLLDHQLLDVDGARVVRAADLYVTRMGQGHRLVGVDVSFSSFLRRILPGRAGRSATPTKVVDWSTIQSFGRPGDPVRLRQQNRGLERLRPADLADLLEDLGRRERQALLDLLEPEIAADVLEEMEPDDLEEVLRHATVERAADMLSRMEPDEAVDALRDLPGAEREDILNHMASDTSSGLERLLAYDEDVAGGIMTTAMVLLGLDETIEQARLKAVAQRANEDVHCLLVVDEDGRLIDDLPLMDLLAANPDQVVADVVGPPVPGTVPPEADLDEVVEQMTNNRGTSLVVVDGDGHPLGLILADDIIDALVQERGSRRWPWQPGRSAS